MPKRKHNHRSRHEGSGSTTHHHHHRHRTPSLVHWFRKGLRLHDNPSLREGLKGAKIFRCIYILDPWFAGSSDKGVNRWRFLLQCLEDLDSSLRKLNSRLFLIRGQPADVFPRLFKEWGVTKLSFDEDSEPFGRERDQAIQLLAKEARVEVVSRLSHTLYDPLEIQRRNNNSPPLTYKRFQSIVSSMESPPHPVEPITASDIEGMETAIGPDHSDRYGIPTLEELGFDVDNIPPAVWVGGETEAKQRLDRHLERKAWVANFERPRMSPASLMTSSTGLGPYLRFGCLSPRLFYWRLAELYQKVKKSTNIPLSLHGHLLWREFFFAVACNNPNFDTMVGNPICVQIPWSKNPEALERWTDGKTGFPWIDAIMTQLRIEGWIHPLARHAVACFLTRGDLWISWEEGMKVFDDLLLEADWSVNAGNWIWLSCSSFYQHFFHCYCPIKFGKRTDPSGDFVRKYLPILKDYPKEYIFEPWTAPAEVQEQAKCIIGTDYPYPMVNHAEASHVNLEKMKKVYQEISQYIGPGLLAAVPSSNSDSGPVPDKTKITTMATDHKRDKTKTVSSLNFGASSGTSSQHHQTMNLARPHHHQPMYSTTSASSSIPMTTGSTSYISSVVPNYTQNYLSSASTELMPPPQSPPTPMQSSVPSNYMVTSAGNMVIPSHYAPSMATVLPPVPPYTDSVLTSNLDTINYTPLRMDSSNPMMGIMHPQKQYQYQ